MYEVTFKLNNREKFYNADTVDSAYEKFLDEYGEALNELEYVTVYCSVIGKGSKYPATGFRKAYKHVEDYVGDKVTDKLTGGHGDELNQEDIDHQTKYGMED